MLSIEELEILLKFLERVPVTGHREARNLAAIAIKLEQFKLARIDAELSTKYKPAPAPVGDAKPLQEVPIARD